MEATVLRKASPNEARCIIRHDINHYSNLAVCGIYSIPMNTVTETNLTAIDFYAPALRECIKEHAFLSATIGRAVSGEPLFTRPKELDLRNHFRVLSRGDGESPELISMEEEGLLTWAFEQLHNHPDYRFIEVDKVPAWSLDVMRLQPQSNSHRVLISFTYSHSHGDGMSGLVFHRTFCNAFQKALGSGDFFGDLFKSPDILLPNQPDNSTTMPISMSYLIVPALGTYLPKFLIRMFGLSGSAAGPDQKSWDGSPIFTDENTQGMKVTTNIDYKNIPVEALKSVLAICKEKGTTLTPLLNFLIAGTISEAFNKSNQTIEPDANFVAQIPINLRKVLDVPSSLIGNFASAAYLRYEMPDIINQPPVPRDSIWEKLVLQSRHLASSASTLQNQPIGLLRYVSDLRAWMLNKIGERRGSSWEFSNLGSFDPQSSDVVNSDSIRVEQMLFSQPASPQSAPLCFNIVGLKNGGLSICVSWQLGALGLDHIDDTSRDERERTSIRDILDALSRKVDQMASSS